MEKLAVLNQCALFANIAQENLLSMLHCLNAREQSYAKDAFLFLPDAPLSHVYIVLTGSVLIVQEDFWGNRTILARALPGELFGEAFSCAEVERPAVSAMAEGNTTVLAIDYRKILTSCTAACAHHAQLVLNMVRILANKNIQLTRKIEHVTQRSTRAKLLSYLSQAARLSGESRFTVPFDRQEMADFLSVDRSAMSAELSRMQRDGILRYSKNAFELL